LRWVFLPVAIFFKITKSKTINLSMKMKDPSGRLIPKGITETINIIIADGAATYFFTNKRITQKFAFIEIEADKKAKLPETTKYLDRLGKAIKIYPGKNKEEIKKIILKELTKLNFNARK